MNYNKIKPTYISQGEMKLSDQMNNLWQQHVFWTRLLLISIADNLNDLEYTKARLLQNPKDIANLYRIFYGDDVAKKVEDLLTEHLLIGGDIIVALKNKETEKVEQLSKEWHRNADDMAKAFSSFNPYYNEEELRQMLYTHLALTTDEVMARLQQDYKADIEAFDRVEEEALMMAKYFTEGIIQDKMS